LLGKNAVTKPFWFFKHRWSKLERQGADVALFVRAALLNLLVIIMFTGNHQNNEQRPGMTGVFFPQRADREIKKGREEGIVRE
jgi:hypothetical protein